MVDVLRSGNLAADARVPALESAAHVLPPGVRTDGGYVSYDGGRNFTLRFFASGLVAGVHGSSPGDLMPYAKKFADASRGRVHTEGDRLEFCLRTSQGAIGYVGRLSGRSELILSTLSYINGHRTTDGRYRFAER